METRDDQKPTDEQRVFAKSNSTSSSTQGPGKDSFQVTAPSIALPKGGGAIRGMGEKFTANPVTGTGSMTVPIATSPGRSGFGPQLSLSYDSGAGNGPFGFGWSLSLPAITRKTDKGLPKYQDTDDSDVFILSGSEDLVPTLTKNASGKWESQVLRDRIVGGRVYHVRRYRPRIEGLFACIERWTSLPNAQETFWRSISKDNVTTWYGKTPESRIVNPINPSRIFSWLICQSYDDKGNVIVYGYKPENSKNVMVVQAHERNRADQSRSAQRYLKRIRYGNRAPYLPELKEGESWPEPPGASAEDGSSHWLFEVVLDYDEPHYQEKPPDSDQRVFSTAAPRELQTSAWPVRPDPFSTYRAGFEVRSYRLCQRVLMFHHFPGEENVGKDCLVRSTEFGYEFETDHENARVPIYSFLQSVTQSGYVRQGEQYLKKSLPPIEFAYSEPKIQDQIEKVDPNSLENLPMGLDGTTYQWMDLHGEGIPGILTEQAGAWFYKRNWSAIPDKIPDGSKVVRAKFSALETVALKPSIALSSGAQFMDLAGDGQPDFVTLDGPTPGFYEHDEAESWEPFQPFTARLNLDTRDPNLKLVDLNGDGHADVLITEEDAFVWHPSVAEEGFGQASRVAKKRDEEKGPRLVFADGTQSIYLADLSGDGLTDLVRIRNGEVCYWPNLGYGRFGAKVTMDHSPQFDRLDLFDQKRIRLADIDGSGTTDIIYLHRDGVRLYFNQSGNSWSQPRILNVFPHIDDLTTIIPTDLLGNGTACLVWSSPLSGDARRPMRYVKLMGEQKPHLLISMVNNLGAETRVRYAPSTKFYLQDKLNGVPWITKLPFPVHVVEQVETYDHIGKNRFITRYTYHHGYFDGTEREFRGFGRVDQFDTEEFATLTETGELPAGENVDQTSHVPPILTKTWFHTGAYFERQRLEARMAREYYQGDAQAPLLGDTILPDQLSPEETGEACRALKGSMLRQEVYALDRTNKADHPYTVNEQNMTVVQLQPSGSNRHAVFFTHSREAFTSHYERNPADPRIQHALTLEVDDSGNVLKQAAIGYGRRASPLSEQWDRDRQTTPLLTYTENRVTNAIASDDAHRNPLPCEAVTFELIGYTPTGTGARYQFSDFVERDPDAPGRLRHKFNPPEVAYEETAVGTNRRRPIEWVRTLYRRDNMNGLLPLGETEALALPGEGYKLAFTQGLVTQVYGSRVTTSMLPDEGKYVHSEDDAHWWIPSGRLFYSSGPDDSPTVELGEARAHFFLPRRYRDPFHTQTVSTESLVTYDAYDLLVHETRDALGNQMTIGERQWVLPEGTVLPETRRNNYRVLQPELVMDPNRNCAEVRFDALGMVVGTAVMGKPEETPRPGDRFTDAFRIDLTSAEIDQFLADPKGPMAAALLAEATSRILYDLDRFRIKGKPPFAATLARETHVSDLLEGQPTKIQVSFSYSDGFGREIQKKLQAEPGPGVFAEEVMAEKPIAYYRFGELVGATSAEDLSGYDNRSVAVESGVTFGSSGLGVGDTAATFDGQFGRIIVHNSDSLNPPFVTMEALIQWRGPHPAAPGIDQRVLEKSSYSDLEQYHLCVGPDGSVVAGIRTSTHTSSKSLRSTAKIHPNVVSHILATYDGVAIRIYLDGVLDSELSAPGHVNPQLPTSENLVNAGLGLGNQAQQDRPRPFHGIIDEIAIYPRALSPERIRAHAVIAKAGGSSHPRWVSSGWTIYNNKGKPIRQYEPFFSATHDFEFGVTAGVSPVLFYDPAERVVATLHPNHTYEKVVFDPWQQTTYDVNDTCALRNQQTGDPRTDPHIGGYVAEYFKTQPNTWKTWYQERINGEKGPYERAAAEKAAAHADTPTTVHFDALGRSFLTIADNGKDTGGTEQKYHTRTVLDIEGNQREVIDALDRIVMRYDYDVLGSRIHQLSMEAGGRWMLNDVAGKPIRAWDSRGISRRMTYDALRRPLGLFVNEHGTERRAQATLYGEDRGDTTNHRGQVYQVRDGAGLVTNEGYDFKGNLRRSSRQVADVYKRALDWNTSESVGDPFTVITIYDALNRPVTVTTPDGSVYRPTFNEAKLINSVAVNLRGAATETQFVKNIDYNAKGQRTTIEYQNGMKAEYKYDPNTFRLINLTTTRQSDKVQLQALQYTYDPTGNITYIQDDAQQTIYFNGTVVLPENHYTYDAIYRLIETKGREHIGQVAQPETTWNDEWRVKQAHPQDGNALRAYTEQYRYDPVGNFEELVHQASNGNWTRTYTYQEPSLLEPTKFSNRLSGTTVGRASGNVPAERYAYDAHGNMLSMPHLPTMQWDSQDQLTQIDLGGGGTAYYVYDAAGQRTRKVIERQGGTIEERFYVGGYELYRERSGASISLERETLHVMDDKQRLALVETRTLGNDEAPQQLIRYQFSNHLGSASLELDDKANVVSYEEYFPYGSTSYQAVDRGIKAAAKRYRYTGKERDEESGFYYHGARYYAAWLGRWTSCDPSGLVDGSNLYSFARGNSVMRHDPTGRASTPKRQVHRYDIDAHGEFKGTERHGGKNLQSHHPIQDKFSEQNIAGYDRNKAPGQLLETGTGEEHTMISNEQRKQSPSDKSSGIKRWDEKSYSRAREEAVRQYEKAGLIDEQKKGVKALMESDSYHFGLNDTVVKDASGKNVVNKNARLFDNMDIKSPITANDMAGLDFDKAFADDPKLGFSGKPRDILEVSSEKVNELRKAGATAAEKGAKEAPGVWTKLAKGVGGVLLEKGEKVIPAVGTGVGVGSAAYELSKGNYANALVEAAGASEIPIVAQVADFGSLAADVSWAVKEVLDQDQKLEQWWYNAFLK